MDDLAILKVVDLSKVTTKDLFTSPNPEIMRCARILNIPPAEVQGACTSFYMKCKKHQKGK